MSSSHPVQQALFQFVQQSTGGLTATGAAVANTGNALASFLLGQVNTFSIDLQDETSEAPGGDLGVLRPG